jgi:hypothetical protein
MMSPSGLLNRTPMPPSSSHLRCDPSIINYLSHQLLATHNSNLFLDTSTYSYSDGNVQRPLAESSRRVHDEDEPTLLVEDDDDQQHTGPLTSTFVDRWYTVSKPYTATFREDLTVRKTEPVQVLRSTHPHWVWIRNEMGHEGFVPTDCLLLV